jgi:hypothetical protein
VGAVPNWNDNWTGDIAEVLVYDHQLSSAEMQQVGGYLANKYGLYNPNATWPQSYSSAVQSEITRNQWNKSQADAYVALQAANPTMLTNGLKAWFKADSLPTNSTAISSWADQTGNYPVTQSSGTAQPTYVPNDINGLPAVRFNGSQSLFNPANIGLNADMTMLVVSETPTPGTAQVALYFGGSPTHNVNRGLGITNSDQLFTAFSNDYYGGAVPSAYTFSVQAVSVNSSLSGINFYLNGALNLSPSISGLQPVAAGISVGAVPNWNDNWTGDIAEVLVYDHQLSSAEMQQVGGYLADKYGLYSPDATWYNSAPYLAIKNEIIQHQWSKAQADPYAVLQSNSSGVVTGGLVLWLNADMGVSVDGGGNMSMVDQAGNYKLTSSSLANQPTLVPNDCNGHAALRFNGSQWLANTNSEFPTGLSSDLTVVTVGITSNPSGKTYSIYLGQNNTAGQNRAVGYMNYNEYFDANNSASNGGGALGAFTAEAVTLDPTLSHIGFYQNGSATVPGTVSAIQNLSPGITLGAAPAGINGWQGDICEVLVYDHQLSSSDLQKLSFYLAAKYGLTYGGFGAPGISPTGGTYTGSTSVVLTAPGSPAVVKYTIDGSEPTINSAIYTGPITLSASAMMKAAVFFNGAISSPMASAQFYVNDPSHTGLPMPPTSLTATSISSTENDLSWQLGATIDYSMINVYRSSDGGATWQLLTALDPTTSFYHDTNVQSGTKYVYYIGTFNSSGESDTAASASLTPPSMATLTITVTTPSSATALR